MIGEFREAQSRKLRIRADQLMGAKSDVKPIFFRIYDIEYSSLRTRWCMVCIADQPPPTGLRFNCSSLYFDIDCKNTRTVSVYRLLREMIEGFIYKIDFQYIKFYMTYL